MFAVVLRSIAITLLLFIAVYMPAFAIAGGLRLPPDRMVPTVMVITLAVACMLIGVAAYRRWLSLADFGFRCPTWSYLACALVLAVPLSAVIAWALSHANEPGPLGGLSLTPWLAGLYFAVGAPIQEEVIFRALLQTTFARQMMSIPNCAAVSGIAASVSVALLFGAIHLVVGPMTALGALLLGVLAGELSRRSGSLLPAIVSHSIFNLGGILWALH